jgi:hypothetical protein
LKAAAQTNQHALEYEDFAPALEESGLEKKNDLHNSFDVHHNTDAWLKRSGSGRWRRPCGNERISYEDQLMIIKPQAMGSSAIKAACAAAVVIGSAAPQPKTKVYPLPLALRSIHSHVCPCK